MRVRIYVYRDKIEMFYIHRLTREELFSFLAPVESYRAFGTRRERLTLDTSPTSVRKSSRS